MLLAGKHVFLVEDNPTNLAVMSSILRQNGATVSFDHWGDTTLWNMMQLEHIDIILLDLMLPRQVSGYDIYDVIVVPVNVRDQADLEREKCDLFDDHPMHMANNCAWYNHWVTSQHISENMGLTFTFLLDFAIIILIY